VLKISSPPKKIMAEYDLTKTVIPYLDRHLVFPLLAWLVDNTTFPVKEVQIAQYELAKGTNMHDYAVSLFQQIHPDELAPEGEFSIVLQRRAARTVDTFFLISVEFAKKREEVVSTNERLQQEAQAVLNVIENPDVAQSLRQDKIQNLQYLKDNFGVHALCRVTHSCAYFRFSMRIVDARAN
jgi:translation initiation factor 3 subunit E